MEPPYRYSTSPRRPPARHFYYKSAPEVPRLYDEPRTSVVRPSPPAPKPLVRPPPRRNYQDLNIGRTSYSEPRKSTMSKYNNQRNGRVTVKYPETLRTYLTQRYQNQLEKDKQQSYDAPKLLRRTYSEQKYPSSHGTSYTPRSYKNSRVSQHKPSWTHFKRPTSSRAYKKSPSVRNAYKSTKPYFKSLSVSNQRVSSRYDNRFIEDQTVNYDNGYILEQPKYYQTPYNDRKITDGTRADEPYVYRRMNISRKLLSKDQEFSDDNTTPAVFDETKTQMPNGNSDLVNYPLREAAVKEGRVTFARAKDLNILEDVPSHTLQTSTPVDISAFLERSRKAKVPLEELLSSKSFLSIVKKNTHLSLKALLKTLPEHPQLFQYLTKQLSPTLDERLANNIFVRK